LWHGRFAAEDSSGYHPQKGQVLHGRSAEHPNESHLARAGLRRRAAKLTRRNLSSSRCPGVTPERPNRVRELDTSQAWSTPPRRYDSSRLAAVRGRVLAVGTRRHHSKSRARSMSVTATLRQPPHQFRFASYLYSSRETAIKHVA
jgi:hypothetical protein